MSAKTYHLIIGSNLGDRTGQLASARKMIAEELGPITRESAIYETEPWGYKDQPWFLNQALEVRSTIDPVKALEILRHIEVKCGRTPGEKWHARHMDIDIILYGNEVIHRPGLEVPHPHLAERNFVLIPLMDIAPETLHPVLGKTIEELYFESRDTGEVYIFNPDEQSKPL